MARTFDLSDADRSVRGPLAEHRFLTLTQVALLTGDGADAARARLQRLREGRMLRVEPIFHELPPAVSIAAAGLRAIDSPLRTPPQINLNQYNHEVGVGWLWLAARSGRYGELTGLVTERRMQADDRAAGAAGEPAPWGVGLGLLNRFGSARRHYPDLMLEMASGHRVAVELELSRKTDTALSTIMTAYASDASVDHVLYLAGSASIAKQIRAAAVRAEIPERVHVQVLAPDGIAGASRVGARSHGSTGRVRPAGPTRASSTAARGAER